MLEASDIRASYGRIPILNGVSLRVAAGEAVGVLGHNGMGKTTLLKALIGLVPLTAGSIRFDGAEIGGEPAHRRARRGLDHEGEPTIGGLGGVAAAEMREELVAVDAPIGLGLDRIRLLAEDDPDQAGERP